MDKLARSAARRAVAEHAAAHPRVKLCGRRRYRRHVDVLHVNGSAWFDGVVRCRNRMCPVCWTQRRVTLAREIGHVVAERSQATQRMPVLATLTIRHSARDPAAICRDLRSRCWRKFVAGRWWVDFRARYGMEWVAAEEVTRGDNGWHPHMHLLLLPTRESGDVLAARDEWHGRWARIVERELGREHVPTAEHGVDFRLSSRAEYLAKLGLDTDPLPMRAGMELTDSANVKGRAPMALLQRALAGDGQALELYVVLQLSRHRCRDVTYSAAASALRKTMPDAPQPERAFVLRGIEYERLAAMGDEALFAVLAAVAAGAGQERAEQLLCAPLAGPEQEDPLPSVEARAAVLGSSQLA